MEEAYVDKIILCSHEFSRCFEEDLGSEVVFWFDVAHVHHRSLLPLRYIGTQVGRTFRTVDNHVPLVPVCKTRVALPFTVVLVLVRYLLTVTRA